MYELLVMELVGADEQSRQLRAFFKSLGAKSIAEEPDKNIAEDIVQLIDNFDYLATLSNQDLEMVLNSIVSLVIAVPRDSSCDLVISKMYEKLACDIFCGREAILLHILSNLFYGLYGSAAQQFAVYCSMLQLAARSGLTKSMITDLSRVNTWFEQWALPVEDRRKCLRLLHAALSKGQQAEELARVMFELLSTYKTDADALKAQNDARECVRAALCDPGTFLFDHLLSLKPVQSLKTDANGDGKRLYDLLSIFVDGRLVDFEAWCAKEKKLAETLPLPVLTYKIRVLTLCSVCDSRTEVPLTEIAEGVKLPLGDQLDEFIIKAMRTQTIRAKIDQINNRLIVGGVKNRRFCAPEWEQLRAKLDSWSTSLRQVKNYLHNVTSVEN